MYKTALYDALVASGARMSEYSGVETASAFNDVASEFRELSSGCALYDLGWRAKVAISGEDRVRWLNGIVTNNVKDLPLNRGNYSFVLNPQGRILGDLYAYNRGRYFLIDTERFQLESLLKLFEHYIIMDDVEVTDKSDSLTAVGIQGSQAGEILKRAGIDDPGLEPMQVADLTLGGIELSLTRMATPEFRTYEIWVSQSAITQLWKSLIQAGAILVGTDALEKFRVMIGFPKYGTDIRDRDLPQETDQTHALNFSKGCYIGQEIVERIRSRGNVHRKFQGFVLEGELPGRGTKLEADGKEVGELTSISRIPTNNGDRSIALGYIRREALERGAKITYAGGEARPSEIPFSVAS
ncbi:MAG: folate-binding protein YgfZ [Acidobacteria bacterium]|nr:MAG: folate-binding protein YgfZ [Acidobacteriota bacterium]PYY21764.1 MAG: folate-binding protein YgfZ [Acidobacteriota bacterium]